MVLGLPVGDLERVAAESTEDRHDTPMVTRFDAQGRPVVPVADVGRGTTYLTQVELDIVGNVLTVTDARDNSAQTSVHGMLGRLLETDSLDAEQWRSMVDVMGTPLRAFDDPAFGHSARIKPPKLIDRARSKGHQIGQWADDKLTADLAKRGPGVNVMPLPAGVKGRSFLANGDQVIADMAFAVVKPDGGIRSTNRVVTVRSV